MRVAAMTEATVQITRYPNRRFYTRTESRYVSLEEIEQMVRDGKQVEIRDSQTDEDLTATVLTRIIMDRQPEKMRLFPIDMLHVIVRSNDVMSEFLRDYFRHALPYLDYLQRHNPAVSIVQPVHWVKAWLDGIAPRKANETSRPTSTTAAPLEQRIAELEERIRQLESGQPQPPSSHEPVPKEAGM
jgi:polyhydroxyalkanoate synthesis repressor PhaR